ncbi:hypothetical protein CASFOL_016954 [Castilleja foliolosa]|uniref:Uncharacterized protein n=1 Tax=Castilleja foliolosa TaxID=1961234 RepID=A0ABD3DE09_9LAMI
MSGLKFCKHTRPKPEVENKIDPDDGNSWMCDACCLPIFSTPFVTTVDPNDPNNIRVMHDQCAHDLPTKLEGLHSLHLMEDLVLHQDSTTNNNKSCSRS